MEHLIRTEDTDFGLWKLKLQGNTAERQVERGEAQEGHLTGLW